MLSGISDLTAYRGSLCPLLKVFTLCVLSADFIPITAPSFFIVLCRLVPTCTVKGKPQELYRSRGLNKLVYTMSTYPPGACSNDGVKSPRMLVLYAATTIPIGANCPQSVCCFSDMLQVLVIVKLFSPGLNYAHLKGVFGDFC